MRLIDADKVDFNEVFVGASDFARETRETAKSLIDMQPTVIEGVVKKSEYAYRRTTSLKPTEHHYEEPGEKPYIKYSCPVCEALGNLHQVMPVTQNCPVCGVQLYWGKYEPVHKKWMEQRNVMNDAEMI